MNIKAIISFALLSLFSLASFGQSNLTEQLSDIGPIADSIEPIVLSDEDDESNQFKTSNSFGTDGQDFWVTADKFHPRGSNQLRYGAHGYYFRSGGGTENRFDAQVPLPAGAEIRLMRCYFFDSNGSFNGGVRLITQNVYGVGTDTQGFGPPSTTSISDFLVTSGTPGYVSVVERDNHTVRYRNGVAPDTDSTYHLRLLLPNSGSVQFKGCRFFWSRQIKPAPATASFFDVPKSNPFFQSVEAMVDAGITGGCGGGNFCPNSPVTRGQMAAFLSRALGLHWPN